MSKFTSVAAVAFSLLCAATPALCRPALSVTTDADGRRQTVVDYSDLDTATPAGAAALAARIRLAVREVCGPRPQTLRDLGAEQAFEHCVSDSSQTAVAEMGARRMRVAALHTR
jgi:UrcA family protein